MDTKELIKKYDIRASKRYGQNFLVDERVIRRIVEGSGITEEDIVFEIGPGTGNMTHHLSETAGKVVAIEVDESLKEALSEALSDCGNVTLVWGDILKLDLREMIEREAGGREVKVVSNLPYYITTPIITYLLESRLPISSITVMIQREVAERMMAVPGTKNYGALTLLTDYHSTVEVIANVPPNAFIPRPNVDSTVVRLDLTGKPDIKVSDEALMFRLIRAAFNQRRKTFINAVKNSPELSYGREEAEEVLRELGFDKNIRGEVLSVGEFAEIADSLSGKKQKRHPALNSRHEPV